MASTTSDYNVGSPFSSSRGLGGGGRGRSGVGQRRRSGGRFGLLLLLSRKYAGRELGVLWTKPFCLEGHFAQDEFAAAIASIKTPMAYIGATHPLGDPAPFLRAAPHAMTAQTLTAPQQISSMLSTFIRSTGRTNLP